MKQKDWYEELNEKQKRAIQKGIDDIENGRCYTNEEVRKNIRAMIENKKANPSNKKK